MNQKVILGLSIGLTTLILTGVVVFTRINSVENSVKDPISPELQLQLTTREEAYNQIISQANQQIQDLNNQVSALQDGSSIISGKKTITMEEAIQSARQMLSEEDYLLGIPRIVELQSSTAFEVNFTSGTVYVDAFNGDIIESSIPVKIDSQQAIAIAGDYLGITDLSKATVQEVDIEGSAFYKVTIDKYVFYIDSYGNISKIQEIQYTTTSSGGSSSTSSHEHEREDEHEDEDD